MQWSPDRNAGFSRADPQRLYLPPIMDAVYGYEAVNVEAQAREPSSLLNWTKRLLAVRKGSKAFGRGRLTFLKPGNRKVLAFLREYGEEVVLCVANLARSAQPVELDLARFKGRVPVELMGLTPFPPVGELPYLLTLPAHNFYWFRLATDAEVPGWYEQRTPREELPVLVLFDGWSSLFRDRVVPWRIGMADKVRAQLELEAVPRFISAQRWYAAKGQAVARAALSDHALLESQQTQWLVGLFDVNNETGHSTYFLPLALAWEDGQEERLKALHPVTLARVRQQAQVGVLADALADEAFCHALVAAIAGGQELTCSSGRIQFTRTNAFAELVGEDSAALAIDPTPGHGRNTGVALGQRLFLKAFRQLHPGMNPELELGRFLTDAVRFRNSVRLAGAVEYRQPDGTPVTLALLQAYLENQGDGWAYTVDYLERFLSEWGTTAAAPPDDPHGAYLALVRTLALRIAELHLALATRTGDPAFDPELIEPRDVAAWKRSTVDKCAAALALLEQRRDELAPAARTEAAALLDARAALLQRIEVGVPARIEAIKTRYHGNLQLGQVLLHSNDFFIIDFEGEPDCAPSERRAKHSPLRDVAGMLRSFDCARHAALMRATAHRPEEYARLEPLTAAWEGEVRRVFLRTYEDRTREGILFGSFEAVRGLLALFELDKALYELSCELASRADWVHVPLRGLLALARDASR
jgi:maltose alpha-D-glucosyltransferase/alpha-amylase